MTKSGQCPIWGTPAEVHPMTGLLEYMVQSDRAGGRYIVDDLSRMHLEGCTEDERVLITDWLVERRSLGEKAPKLLGDIDIILSRRSKNVKERCEALLLFVDANQLKVGEQFSTSAYGLVGMFVEQPEMEPFGAQLRAHTSSTTDDETQFLAQQLLSQGFVESVGKTGYGPYVITLKGYEFLENLRGTNVESNRAFVAMWFGENMNKVFEEAIAEGIKDAGYEPIRIDKKHHNNKIDDEIIAELRRARFVVADFTHGDDGMRGGVYYEAGFARGMGLEVISTCEQSLLSENKIHFDTRQFNHIGWSLDQLPAFREALANRISATVGDGPMK